MKDKCLTMIPYKSTFKIRIELLRSELVNFTLLRKLAKSRDNAVVKPPEYED